MHVPMYLPTYLSTYLKLNDVNDFSAEGKKASLYGFWKDVLKGKPMVCM